MIGLVTVQGSRVSLVPGNSTCSCEAINYDDEKETREEEKEEEEEE